MTSKYPYTQTRGQKREPLSYPVGVAGVLKAALARHGLDKKVEKYEFVLHWRKVVGEEVANRTKLEGIRNGVLSVRVVNSVWAQELSLRRAEILERLKPYLTEGTMVNEIVFRLGDIARASR